MNDKIKKAVAKYKTFEYYLCLKCMQIHGNPGQIPGFILWIIPRHLSSKSFLHGVIWLVWCFGFWVHPLIHHCTSFFHWNFFLYYTRYQFPDTRMHVCNWAFHFPARAFYAIVYSWHVVTCPWVDVPRALWKTRVQPSAPLCRPLRQLFM